MRQVTLDADTDGISWAAHVFEYQGEPPRPLRFFSVNLEEAVFGDVSGDGADNALFFTACFWGNGLSYDITVWGHDEQGSPLQLPVMEQANKFTRLFGHLEVVDGEAILQTFEGAPGDPQPHINGFDVEVVTAYRFTDTGWAQTELSRSNRASQ